MNKSYKKRGGGGGEMVEMILKKIYITVHTPGIVVSVFCQSVLLVMVIYYCPCRESNT